MLPVDKIDRLFVSALKNRGFSLKVDLRYQKIYDQVGNIIPFKIELFRKAALVKGLDEIGSTLTYKNEIQLFEEKHKKSQSGLFKE